MADKNTFPSKSIFRRFLGCTKASSAIEFAMVVPIFLAVVFSIFEVGYMFLTDLALETALTNAARLVRTGQAHTSTMTMAQFKTVLCDGTYGLVDCNNVTVEVNVFNSFEDGNTLPPLLDENGDLADNSVFNIGNSSSIIVVRITYLYDIINPIGNAIQLSNYGDNQYLQAHLVAFKNEPFN